MMQKDGKGPDWTPAGPGAPWEDSPETPEAAGRWLEDGGRTLERDAPIRGEAELADALGHTGWRPAEAHLPDPEAPAFPGSGFLDALFLDFPFPASKHEVACHLAEDAALHEGPAETFHDLVVRLDRAGFEDIHDLKRALGDRFAREPAHPEGGRHDR